MRQILSIFIIATLLISCEAAKKAVQETARDVEHIPDKVVNTANEEFDNITIKNPLNDDEEETYQPTTPDSSIMNHASWNDLLQKHVSEDGKVRYADFLKDHAQLKGYIVELGTQVPADDASKEAVLAYWINAYNALTVDLILQNYPLESIKDIRKPWRQRNWKLGDKMYNLNEIEHEILRELNEPRIHFAINCASFSCPPLLNEAFTASNLESQLTEVTKTFLADTQRNTIAQNQLEISKIFKWFSKDFKQNGSLIDFLNQYSATKIDADAKINYKEYDWSLNAY